MVRSRTNGKTADQQRAAANPSNVKVVRETGVLAWFRSYMVKVAKHRARRRRRAVGNMANPTRPEHSLGYRFLRQLFCQTLPIVTSLIIGGVGVWLYGNREPPRIILNAVIFPNMVQAGGHMTVIYVVTDYRECSGITHRWIVDSSGIIHALPDAPVFHKFWDVTGKQSTTYQFSREVKVPATAAIGPALFHAQTQRWCSPVQWFFPLIETEEAKFMVSP